jgi:hypothetical protein
MVTRNNGLLVFRTLYCLRQISNSAVSLILLLGIGLRVALVIKTWALPSLNSQSCGTCRLVAEVSRQTVWMGKSSTLPKWHLSGQRGSMPTGSAVPVEEGEISDQSL